MRAPAKKRSVPLAGVRKKISAAVTAMKRKGIRLGAGVWGIHNSGSGWALNVGVCCPMAACILHYDRVDNIINHDAAAAKVLRTPTNNVRAFISGFDNSESDAFYSAAEKQWFKLGQSFIRRISE